MTAALDAALGADGSTDPPLPLGVLEMEVREGTGAAEACTTSVAGIGAASANKPDQSYDPDLQDLYLRGTISCISRRVRDLYLNLYDVDCISITAQAQVERKSVLERDKWSPCIIYLRVFQRLLEVRQE